jgi:hypothetical protein
MAEYRVRVYNARIVSLIQVGDVALWSHDTAKDIENLARLIAPERTGRLKSSHVTLPGVGTNQYVKRWRVSAMAPHARFVHEGTGIHGPLRSRVFIGKRMGPLPAPFPKYVWSHQGTRRNPWLERAAMIVSARI